VTKKRKTGPKPKPIAEKMRHAVMVRFADREFAEVKRLAAPRPVAAYLRDKGLAS